MVQLLWKPVWKFFKRLITELPCDPAPYPEEWETYVLTKTCTLFTVAKKLKRVDVLQPINGQNVVHPYSETLFGNKKERHPDDSFCDVDET